MHESKFFQQLDQKIAADAQKKRDEQISQRALSLATREAIKTALPTLERYKKALQERGINVELLVSEDELTFDLKYAGSGHRGLVIKEARIRNTFSEKADEVGLGISRGVDVAIFEKYLQGVIEDFMANAEANGGFRSQAKAQAEVKGQG